MLSFQFSKGIFDLKAELQLKNIHLNFDLDLDVKNHHPSVIYVKKLYHSVFGPICAEALILMIGRYIPFVHNLSRSIDWHRQSATFYRKKMFSISSGTSLKV